MISIIKNDNLIYNDASILEIIFFEEKNPILNNLNLRNINNTVIVMITGV